MERQKQNLEKKDEIAKEKEKISATSENVYPVKGSKIQSNTPKSNL